LTEKFIEHSRITFVPTTYSLVLAGVGFTASVILTSISFCSSLALARKRICSFNNTDSVILAVVIWAFCFFLACRARPGECTLTEKFIEHIRINIVPTTYSLVLAGVGFTDIIYCFTLLSGGTGFAVTFQSQIRVTAR